MGSHSKEGTYGSELQKNDLKTLYRRMDRLAKDREGSECPVAQKNISSMSPTIIGKGSPVQKNAGNGKTRRGNIHPEEIMEVGSEPMKAKRRSKGKLQRQSRK